MIPFVHQVAKASMKRAAEDLDIQALKVKKMWVVIISQGHNFYKLKYISLEEVKIVPFQQ